jgi:hypothetical protein
MAAEPGAGERTPQRARGQERALTSFLATKRFLVAIRELGKRLKVGRILRDEGAVLERLSVGFEVVSGAEVVDLLKESVARDAMKWILDPAS